MKRRLIPTLLFTLAVLFGVAPARAATFVDTTQSDFQAGVATNVDLTSSPGDAVLVPAPLDQQNTAGTTTGTGFGTPNWTGQTFIPAVTGQLLKVDFQLFGNGVNAPAPNLTLSIRNTSGGLPTGADLATATTPGVLNAEGTVTRTASFAAPPTLTAGTTYAIILRPVSAPSGSGYFWIRSSPSTYASGSRVLSADSGGIWSADTTRDYNFKTYMATVAGPQGDFISSTKDSMPGSHVTLWQSLFWTASTPASTSVKFQAAGSSSSSGPFNFVGPDGTSASYFTSSGASLSQFNGSRYLQYRAFLQTTDIFTVPTLNDVTVAAAYTAAFVDTTHTDFEVGTGTGLDTTTSPGDVLLPLANQSNTTNGNVSNSSVTITVWGGQTFTPSITGQLVKADFKFFTASFTGAGPDLTVSLRATTGGLPTGADLASATIPGFISNTAFVIESATFAAPATVTAGTQYALVIRPLSNPSAGSYVLARSGTATAGADVYAGGALIAGSGSGTTWSVTNVGGVSADTAFAVYIATGSPVTGDLISSTKDGSLAAQTPLWSSLAWTGATPASTSVKFQVAGSNSSSGPFNFVGPDATAATYFTASGADLSPFIGNRYLQYHAYLQTDDVTVTPSLSDVTVNLVEREIAISGTGVEIPSGDTTPAAADGTDFGTVNLTGATVVRTFTIANAGAGNLNLTGTPGKVAISGTGAASFAVTAQPTSPVGANGTTTFQITFTPSGSGAQTATVTVANDDADEGTYTFAIAGTGMNAPIVVNTTDDSQGAGGGVLSLRDAILQANSQGGDDTITLPAGTIMLTSPLPAITQNTTITGEAGGTIMSGGGQFQVFNVTGGNVSFDGLTIANGLGTPGAPGGGTAGGLQIGGAANVTVTNCLFTNNLGGPGDSTNGDLNQGRGAGGGLQTNSSGTVTIRNSTFYGNVGGAGGGQGRGGAGGVQFENGIHYFESNTVAGNTGGGTRGSGGGGTGGAFTINQSPIVTNSLFADNIAGTGATFNGAVDFGGTMSSGGYNLIQDTVGTNVGVLQMSDLQNVNAGLDPAGPRDHGGRTRTIRLGAGSKALDAGKAPLGGNTDQRGQARPVDLADAGYPNAAGGDGTDIGAYELPNAPIVVTSDSDTPAAGVLTLREAIALAESQPGEDNIVFNIPGAGVHTIVLGSQLPTITQPLTIDGYSQPGAQVNTQAVGSDAVILIELQGPGLGTFNGLNITGAGNTIRGLAIGGFEWGIGLGGDGNVISGNYVGVHADGVTAFNNNNGLVAYVAPNSIIGGARPADRNVISSNSTSGIYLSTSGGPGTAGTVVRGNYIGTNAAGTAALGDAFYGIDLIGATDITIGGTAPGAGNLLSGNAHAIHMEAGNTRITIQGNRIGVNAAGTANVSNDYGVVIYGPVSGNTIGGTAPGAGNLITGSVLSGIFIFLDSTNNAVRGNSIYGNGSLNLNLVSDTDDGTGITPNDDGDADIGANHLQNYPVITSVTVNGGNLVINGTLNSTADTAFALDFFNNAAAGREGQTYLGSGSVTTAGNNGAFSITLPGVTVPEETYLTATATDPTANTSEFSAPTVYFTGAIQTGPNFVVNTPADSNKLPTTTECSLREAIAAANAFNGTCSITFDPSVFAAAQTITLNKGELQLTNNMTITGPAAGLTVDGDDLDRVFGLPGGIYPTVTISGLTVTRGHASGIHVGGGKLTLQNCVVSKSSSPADGGGIDNRSVLVLQNCTITQNTAAQKGGGIHSAGFLTISGSTIANNTGGNYGGGIYTAGSASITSSTLSDNTTDRGGGIYADGSLSIAASTIAGNTARAPDSGAGLHNVGSAASVANSTISGNHADKGGAGAIWAGSSLTVANCTITANTADGTYDANSTGGVRSDILVFQKAEVTVSNTIIAGNRGIGGATADVNNAGGSGGTFTSKGDNLIGDGTGATGFTAGANGNLVGTTVNPIDPRLGPLVNNGGLTLTHPLLTTPIVSPAIDAGNSGLDTDQRGFARGFDNPAATNGSGNLSDIGAVEQGSTVTPVVQTGPNFVVNTTGDDDDLPTSTNCSLREAINAANSLAPGTATITFDPTVFATPQTITLGGSELVILHAMTITGPGADKLTISGNNQSRIFTVNTADGLNTISGVSVTGGNGTAQLVRGFGGGIYTLGDLLLVDCTITGNSALVGGGVHSYSSATLTMRGCTISNNTARDDRGGGVDSYGRASITNCTISGNHADRAGAAGNAGGVWNERGAMTISNCTITRNTAAGTRGSGGVRSAIFGGAGSITVRNSIIAGNTGTGGATADVSNASGATLFSEGFNLIGDGAGSNAFVNGTNHDQVGTTAHPLDPFLGPLASNGGPTLTHALLAFSPAIDQGKAFGSVTTDQRGLTRPINLANGTYPNAPAGDGSDIGAYEAQVAPPLPPYLGVNDTAITARGETRIYPLANDVSPSGLPMHLVSVTNPLILISPDRRSLIIPAGFAGTFTYLFSDGTILGRASITVAARPPGTATQFYNGLLRDGTGALAGSVDVAFTPRRSAATVLLKVGTAVARTIVIPHGQGGTIPRATVFGPLVLAFNPDGTVTANVAEPDNPLTGVLTVRHAPSARARYHVALASVDAAIPGGGFAYVTVLADSRAIVTALLPDGSVFSAGTASRENSTIPLFSAVRRGVSPPALVGGELVLADLLASDLTGEWAWMKPVQNSGVPGVHLDGVGTLLTANGSRYDGQIPLAGAGTLEVSAGADLATETNAVTVTAGRPAVPTGALKSWIKFPRYGIFWAAVKVPGIPGRVLGRGVYLPKSHTAWGFFPGKTVGGRIELSVP